jgi:hypothetical protein
MYNPHAQRYHQLVTGSGKGAEHSISTDVFVFDYSAFFVNNTDIHGFCMEINSTVIFVLFGVEFHKASFFKRFWVKTSYRNAV